MITLAKNPHGIMATRVDEPRITALAAAVFIANAAYREALTMPNPASTLDDIADALPEVMPEVLSTVKTAPELAEVLHTAIADRVWAYTAIEYARAEAGAGYNYPFDTLVEALEHGADPHVIRAKALDVPRRIRELAEQAGGDE
ncbi:hypothetical protein ABZT34_34530 [Streptomyces sp. NPDC005329]|uniref:hypothetical protein n=1 Tax=Streptomyces sp. NPDC005329 TaxID=3157034 RepID=UPI00339FF607